MARIYDTHAHLGFFGNPCAQAEQLEALGVSALCATVTPDEYVVLRRKLAGVAGVRVGLGLHPWWVADGRCAEAALEQFEGLARGARGARLVSEIGLDYADGREDTRDLQLAFLDRELAACDGEGRVLSLHAVRAAGDLLDALERHGSAEAHACVLHWFSGTGDELARAVRMGCRFSVGPRMLATRRGRDYARKIPPTRLLLETDLPSSADAGQDMGADVLHSGLCEALCALRELRGNAIGEHLAENAAALFAVC